MTRLAECLLPFAGQAELEATLRGFEPAFHQAFNAALLRRLGLQSAGEEADGRLVRQLWKFLIETRAPFEQVFFDWHGGPASRARAERSPAAHHYTSAAFQPVEAAMAAHQLSADARPDHPYFSRAEPCTMLIDEVEAIWGRIAKEDDWSAFTEKLAEIAVMRDAHGITR